MIPSWLDGRELTRHLFRSGIYTVRGLRHDHAFGAPMDEDGHVGHHGSGGGITKRIRNGQSFLRKSCEGVFGSMRDLYLSRNHPFLQHSIMIAMLQLVCGTNSLDVRWSGAADPGV